uniref:Tetratricopeptide repeat domain 6 n=1 Tax=Hucho hucho TaxID=62062 RepID=A0A4W5M2Y3_9TELE
MAGTELIEGIEHIKYMVSMCLIPFHLLHSSHYFEPSSPQQPSVACLCVCEAVESFRKALILLSPNETNLYNVSEAAEVFYLTGLCYMALALLLQAFDAFSNAVKINPDYADAYHQRGLCRMRLQQSKSVQDFNRALFINPNLFQVYLSRAAFYGAKGRYSKAILNCNEAIKIQPKSVRVYLYRGALKFYLKVYKGAVEDLTMALRIDKTCSFAHYNRGVCYQQLKEYELALRDYGIVLLLPSKKEIDLKVLINRALLYVELSDHHNALQDFKAASLRSPEDATIYHALGVYHHRLGQLQESVEAYSQAMQISPFFLDAYVGRGNAYMDYGHTQGTKQAQRDFLSALHLNPLCSNARISSCPSSTSWFNPNPNLSLNPNSNLTLTIASCPHPGSTLTLNLNLSHGYTQLSRHITHMGIHNQLLTNRGVINQFMGDKANAMKDYQRAISLNPKYALAFFNAANLYFYNRQFEQACEHYSQAFELDPADESAVLNRAITRALLREVPEALQDFSEALRLNPYSSHVFFNRANLYCSLRQYRNAEKDLSQALLLQPNDALVYKLRADVRGHLGLTDQAVQDYRTAVELQEALEG